MRIDVEVVDPRGVEGRRAANQAVDFITLGEQ
jgi:hypothetical protein